MIAFVCLLFLLVIVVFMALQFHTLSRLVKELMALKEQLTDKKEHDNTVDIPEGNPLEGNPKDANDEEKETTKAHDDTASKDKVLNGRSHKERVVDAISLRGEEVMEEDLDRVMNELSKFFIEYVNNDYFSDLGSNDYYRFIDLRKNSETRVVVLGDIHCDYLSLSAALLKLSVSEYDYFEKAYFVFLGDYFDRGGNLFEPLLLLMDLKRILGDRMIMLKGNHESIEYDDAKQELKPKVRPHESVDCLNQFCKGDQRFMKQFAVFYSTLPTYVYVKTDRCNMLLTHAAIPRDIFIQQVRFDEADGSLRFDDAVLTGERLSIRNRVFKDMIWGDPSKYEEKIQVEGRFEFGSKQFDRWASRNHIHLLLRSHEEARYGYEPMFGQRLYTLFSTGGQQNPQTGYPQVEPAIGIIRNDAFDIENSFLYKVRESGGGMVCVNLLTKQKYTEKQIEHYKMGNEFVCTKPQYTPNREIFKRLCADNAQTESE